MRRFEICARGPVDDWGWSEPYTAGQHIQRLWDRGTPLTEADIEKIADSYHCYIKWFDDELPPGARFRP